MGEDHPGPAASGHLDGDRLLALGPQETVVENDLWHPLLALAPFSGGACRGPCPPHKPGTTT
eukprot:3496304-Lingulodinium_polyedra.AAC.1